MKSTENNEHIRYEGNALMWQGANRLVADKIFIDRKDGRLEANGNVTSQLLDKSESKGNKKGTTVFTIVKAPR